MTDYDKMILSACKSLAERECANYFKGILSSCSILPSDQSKLIPRQRNDAPARFYRHS